MSPSPFVCVCKRSPVERQSEEERRTASAALHPSPGVRPRSAARWVSRPEIRPPQPRRAQRSDPAAGVPVAADGEPWFFVAVKGEWSNLILMNSAPPLAAAAHFHFSLFFSFSLLLWLPDASNRPLPPNLKRQAIVILKTTNANHCPRRSFPCTSRLGSLQFDGDVGSEWRRVAARLSSPFHRAPSVLPPAPPRSRHCPARQSRGLLAGWQAGRQAAWLPDPRGRFVG